MRFKNTFPQTRGFTLIEILVVIGIIAILAAIVIIAINPAKQFAQARNTQRQSNIDAILNAIGQRMSDHKGIFDGSFSVTGDSLSYVCPVLPSGTSTPIKYDGGHGDNLISGGTNLSCLTPTYIATFPIDPAQSAGNPDTGYTAGIDSTGRVTVCAPNAGTETSIPGATYICVKR
ncbi:MAG: hypothetical protein RLZZ347_608 [Candidatus Parcubacteria bacterium]|jgi:type IV pilus assembly protein PilA